MLDLPFLSLRTWKALAEVELIPTGATSSPALSTPLTAETGKQDKE